MALNIRAYEYLATDASGQVIAAGREPAIASEQVSVGSESSTFSGQTYFLRLYADEAVRLEFGQSPSASGSSTFKMAAGQTEFIGVKPGHKLDTVAA